MESQNTAFARLKEFYITTAVIWLNASIFLFLLIAACYVYSWARPAGLTSRADYAAIARPKALHTISAAAAKQCFIAFQNLQLDMEYLYRPWMGFTERPFQSACLNIDPAEPLPVRRTISASKDANKTIWLFGGSTQFGVGVPDNQTIASNLSQILSKDGFRYNVVNHGHTWYFSTQEAALFANLLRDGKRCDIAIFLDGLNDNVNPTDIPHFADRTSSGFIEEEKKAAGESEKQIIVTPDFPPMRLLNALLRRPSAPKPDVPADYNPVDIYQFNLTAIENMAEAANIKLAAYWQPTPFDYMAGAERARKGNPGYERIPASNALVLQRIKSKDFHFIADLFQKNDFEDIYVDQVHYGDKGNRIVAESIAASLKSGGLLDGK